MIIFEDKNIHQNSLYPDTDWTGEAKWVIPDTDVELCTKVMEYCPYFDVVTDSDNKVIDIIKLETPLSEVISNQLYILSMKCETAITQGIDYNDKHYSLKISDQLNLETLKNSINNNTQFIPYHADGELCTLYTVDEFNEIYKLATCHKLINTTYFNQLKDMILQMTDTEEINNCYYGMELDESHKSNYDKLIETIL